MDVRQIECAAPLYAGIIDKVNFELFTVREHEIVVLVVIVDDIGYQMVAGKVIPFEWHGATERMCWAAVRVHLEREA